MKLTIELVPETCFYTNVRSNVSRAAWDIFRKECARRAGNVCEICGDTGFNQGRKHAVECHEIWEYKDSVQKLTGLIALCPRCHQAKHAGLAQMRGELPRVVAHLMKVNGISEDQAAWQLMLAFDQWARRSKQNWQLDISTLDTYLLTPTT